MSSPDDFRKKLTQAIEILSEPSYLGAIGEVIVDRIVKRTRLGRGVEERGGPSMPLKALASSYKEARKRMKKNGELSNLTTPGKSNLTRTGQMLDSADVVSKKRNSVVLGFKGNHKSGLTNDELAGYMEKGDSNRNRPPRPFFNLSNAEEKFLEKEFEKELQKLIDAL